MFTLFGLRYRAHFCAECGNERNAQRLWQHRFLCQDCASRRGYYRRLGVSIIILGLSAYLLFGRARTGLPPAPAQSPAVSAFDAVGDRSTLASEERPLRVLCGARTRRGTACQRLVPPGERCAQHRGRPSILEANNSR